MYTNQDFMVYSGNKIEKTWRRYVEMHLSSNGSVTLVAMKYKSFWAIQIIDRLPELYDSENQESDNPKFFNCLILKDWNFEKMIEKINYPESENDKNFRYSLVDFVWGEDLLFQTKELILVKCQEMMKTILILHSFMT